MILVDTGPLVALSDPRDEQNTSALRECTHLREEGLVTCEAIVTEACFHLKEPHQRLRLASTLKELRISNVSWPSPGPPWSPVLEWMARYAEHRPDWADACIAVLSGMDKDLHVWTFDKEFTTTWRRPDGSRIPVVARSASD